MNYFKYEHKVDVNKRGQSFQLVFLYITHGNCLISGIKMYYALDLFTRFREQNLITP